MHFEPQPCRASIVTWRRHPKVRQVKEQGEVESEFAIQDLDRSIQPKYPHRLKLSGNSSINTDSHQSVPVPQYL